jgi:hypothetical protein
MKSQSSLRLGYTIGILPGRLEKNSLSPNKARDTEQKHAISSARNPRGQD